MTASPPFTAITDPNGVAPIIDAVRKAYVRKTVAIPSDLDRAALAEDIRKAFVWYRILLAMQKGEWNARAKRGRRLLRANSMGEIRALLDQDSAGKWWKTELSRIVDVEWKPVSDAAKSPADIHVLVTRLLDERFTAKGEDLSARTVLGKGSALEWLIRRPAKGQEEDICLASIFKRHFGMDAKISGSGKMVKEVWHDHTHSPYLAFVKAILAAEGMNVKPGSICAIFRRQKPH